MPSFFPLSDNALCIEFGNKIDEKINLQVIALGKILEQNPFVGFREVIPAYTTLTVFYDVFEIISFKKNTNSAYDFVKNYIENLIQNNSLNLEETKNKIITIPTIYKGEDLAHVAEYCQLCIDDVISIHSNTIYRVFMMGFLPGFAYLGGMDKRIAVPRRESPRKKVLAGSVGIAGNQTGIYPIDSPGGWQLIGRTPISLFDPQKSDPILLKAGDLVKFEES